ncbi:hypothetical protein D3C80_1179660 [compost metagenome]
MIKVITFTGTFTNTGEYGDTAVLLRDVVDQFLDGYGFTNTGTAEQADLTALGIWCQKVDNLDSCFQDFCLCGQFIKGRSQTVNRVTLSCYNFSTVINRVTQHVEHAAQCSCTNRNGDWTALVKGFNSADKSVSG